MAHMRQMSGLIKQQEDEQPRTRFVGIAGIAARTVVVTGLAVGVGLGVTSAANAAEPVPAAHQCYGGDMGPGSCQVDEIGADIVNGIAHNGTSCVKGAIGSGILSGIIKKVAGPPELGVGCVVNVIKKDTGFDGWGLF